MEVLAPLSAGPRNPYLGGGEGFWGHHHHQHQTLPTHHSTSCSRYGPQPPPSPPYDMSNNANGKYSLPPISDLLAFSRADARSSTDRQSESLQSRQSPTQDHRRQPSTGHASPKAALQSPVSASSGREMQPPLVLQPAHNISRIDPALFNESRRRNLQTTSPVTSRPTLDTSSRFPRPSVLLSPYPNSAPVRSQYVDISPRSAVSSVPYYNPPHYEQHPHTLPAPTTPRTMASDSPMQPYEPGVLSPSSRQEESNFQGGRPILPHYPSRSSTSPKLSRTLPSVTSSGHHPYRSHHRHLSQGSTESMQGSRAVPPRSTPSPRLGSQGGQSASASTLQDRYQCPTCSKAFSRPSSLRIHSHSHTGEKPFICPRMGCGKAFSVRSNMKRHERGCHVGMGMAMPHPDHNHHMDTRMRLASDDGDL